VEWEAWVEWVVWMIWAAIFNAYARTEVVKAALAGD